MEHAILSQGSLDHHFLTVLEHIGDDPFINNIKV